MTQYSNMSCIIYDVHVCYMIYMSQYCYMSYEIYCYMLYDIF